MQQHNINFHWLSIPFLTRKIKRDPVTYFTYRKNLIQIAAIVLLIITQSCGELFTDKTRETKKIKYNRALDSDYPEMVCDLDSFTLTLCTGNSGMPELFSFLLFRKIRCNPQPSLIRQMPLLFFMSTFYQNEGYRLWMYTHELNDYITDLALFNIESLDNGWDRSQIRQLRKTYFEGYRSINKNYRYQSEYPDSQYMDLQIVSNEIDPIDSIRIGALNGNMDCMEKLDSLYRLNGNQGEMAYYFYFLALTQKDPDLLFEGAKRMYIASRSHSYALIGAIKFLQVGEHMGSRKCAQALLGIDENIDKMVTSIKQ